MLAALFNVISTETKYSEIFAKEQINCTCSMKGMHIKTIKCVFNIIIGIELISDFLRYPVDVNAFGVRLCLATIAVLESNLKVEVVVLLLQFI